MIVKRSSFKLFYLLYQYVVVHGMLDRFIFSYLWYYEKLFQRIIMNSFTYVAATMKQQAIGKDEKQP